MKDLTKRIEECLARLKELPALIRAEREKMNGKAAIEELKTRLKGLWLGYLSDAKDIRGNTDEGQNVKLYPNEKARERYALRISDGDSEYQQISEEIKRFEHQRNTASMNHESLCKEHSGLISTVDVLREMLIIQYRQEEYKRMGQEEIDRAEEEVEMAKIRRNMLISGFNLNMDKEASSEEG